MQTQRLAHEKSDHRQEADVAIEAHRRRVLEDAFDGEDADDVIAMLYGNANEGEEPAIPRPPDGKLGILEKGRCVRVFDDQRRLCRDDLLDGGERYASEMEFGGILRPFRADDDIGRAGFVEQREEPAPHLEMARH